MPHPEEWEGSRANEHVTQEWVIWTLEEVRECGNFTHPLFENSAKSTHSFPFTLDDVILEKCSDGYCFAILSSFSQQWFHVTMIFHLRRELFSFSIHFCYHLLAWNVTIKNLTKTYARKTFFSVLKHFKSFLPRSILFLICTFVILPYAIIVWTDLF